MSDEDIDNANLEQPEKSELAHFVWQYFAVTNNTDARKGGAKNAVCMFCDKSFSGCSTSRAAAHILGRPVLAQEKAGIRPCIAIYKKDDDRRSADNGIGLEAVGLQFEPYRWRPSGVTWDSSRTVAVIMLRRTPALVQCVVESKPWTGKRGNNK